MLPSHIRAFPHPSESNVTTFYGAGWHFTNFGGLDMILQVLHAAVLLARLCFVCQSATFVLTTLVSMQKMNTFSHTEYKVVSYQSMFLY